MRRALARLVSATALLWTAPAAAQRTYSVLIESEPSGATVILGTDEDGETLGETPYSGKLPEGEHVITVTLQGYSTLVTTIDVQNKRKRQLYGVKLVEMQTGVIAVTAPSGDVAIGAEVRIDGERRGVVPDEFEIEVGPHVVEIVPRGADPYEEWVEVVQGEVVTVSPDFGGGRGRGGGDDSPPDDDPDPPDSTIRRKSRPAPPRPVGEIATAMLVLDTGLDLGGRHYAYSGDMLSNNLRPYDADGVPLVHLGAEVYPLAGHRLAVLRGFGVTGRYDRAPALTSQTMDGTEVDTTWQQWEIGARLRWRVGKAGIVAGAWGYGAVGVTFDGAALMDNPEVEYSYQRLGVDGRYDTGKWGVFGGVSGLLVGSAGASAARFRDASTSGVGAHAGLAYELARKLEARAAVRVERYGSTFTADPGDTYVADAATDLFYGILLGAAFVY